MSLLRSLWKWGWGRSTSGRRSRSSTDQEPSTIKASPSLGRCHSRNSTVRRTRQFHPGLDPPETGVRFRSHGSWSNKKTVALGQRGSLLVNDPGSRKGPGGRGGLTSNLFRRALPGGNGTWLTLKRIVDSRWCSSEGRRFRGPRSGCDRVGK